MTKTILNADSPQILRCFWEKKMSDSVEKQNEIFAKKFQDSEKNHQMHALEYRINWEIFRMQVKLIYLLPGTKVIETSQ